MEKLNMRHLFSKDLGIIFLLTAIYILIISFPNFNYGKFVIDLIFLISLFLFTGYSIISLLRPEENYNNILRKPVLILEFSVLIILAISLILKFSSLGLNLRLLVMVLSILTMILSIAAYIRRISYFKSGGKPLQIQKSKKILEKKSIQKQRANFKFNNHIDLIIIDLLSIVTLASFFIISLNISLIHNILGSLFLLFLPGYVIVVVLLPKKEELDIRIRLGLSIGLSLPITSLIGTALYFTVYGITVNSLSFVLAILTLFMCILAHVRRARISQ
jgi:uncharacterized membrane protein